MATVVNVPRDERGAEEQAAVSQALSFVFGQLIPTMTNTIKMNRDNEILDQSVLAAANSKNPKEMFLALAPIFKSNPNMLPQVMAGAANMFESDVKVLKHKFYVTNPDGSKSPFEFYGRQDEDVTQTLERAQGIFGQQGKVSLEGKGEYGEPMYQTDQGTIPLKDAVKLNQMENAKRRTDLYQQSLEDRRRHEQTMEGIASQRSSGTGRRENLSDAERAAIAEAADALHGGDQGKVSEAERNKYLAIRQRRVDAFALGTKSTGMAGNVAEPLDPTGLKTTIENLHPDDPMRAQAEKRLKALSPGDSAAEETPIDAAQAKQFVGMKKKVKLPSGQVVEGVIAIKNGKLILDAGK